MLFELKILEQADNKIQVKKKILEQASNARLLQCLVFYCACVLLAPKGLGANHKVSPKSKKYNNKNVFGFRI
jgi:hypothetical protein